MKCPQMAGLQRQKECQRLTGTRYRNRDQRQWGKRGGGLPSAPLTLRIWPQNTLFIPTALSSYCNYLFNISLPL